ncbi:hypothetical protein BCR44DRAFT_1500583 [Catenaria anguillulae PL171]|uniref:Uncharacterized protein n=1 Tax=Catenaria anguillulae PL171 TaxID=765915 RepID=A0A1Y2HIH3_9FUNG|nr:hypothetical protein BCR44DRAFT_1500583 [Catenaria anguillulae PL171]
MAPAPPHSLNSSSSQLGSPPSSMTQMFKLPAFTQAPGPLTDSESDSQGLRRLPSTFQNAAGFSHSQSQSDLAEESPAAAQLKPENTRSATRHLNLATLGVLPQQAGKLGADRARANESGSDTDDGDEDESTAQVDDWDAEEEAETLEAGISDEEEERDFGAADKNEQSDGGGDDDDDFPVRRHKRARRSLAQAIADVSESTEPAVSKDPRLASHAALRAKSSPSVQPKLSLIESLFGAGRGVNASRPPVRSAVSLAPPSKQDQFQFRQPVTFSDPPVNPPQQV